MTHQELQEQIATLQAQADELKRFEKGLAIDQVKATIAANQLTAEDIGFNTKTKKKARTPATPKYRNPANPSQTWTGRGRKPAWVKNYANLDDLLIPA